MADDRQSDHRFAHAEARDGPLTIINRWGTCAWVLALLVAILVTPADVPTALTDTLLQACEEALGAGGCAFHAENAAAPPPAWLAKVRWSHARRQARLEVRAVHASGPCAVRRVPFGRGDRPEEQFRAMGLLVAAMVARCRGDDTADEDVARASPLQGPAEPEAPPPPPQPVAAPPPADSRARPQPRLDVGTVGGSGFRSLVSRWGVRLQAALVPTTAVFAPHIDVTVAEERGAARVRWGAGAVGLLARLWHGGPWRLEAILALIAERMWFSASDGSRTETAAGWQWGGRLGAMVGWVPRHVGLFFGAEGVVRAPPTALEVAGEPQGTSGLLGLHLLAGLRIQP
jgi:hypothetical protein